MYTEREGERETERNIIYYEDLALDTDVVPLAAEGRVPLAWGESALHATGSTSYIHVIIVYLSF